MKSFRNKLIIGTILVAVFITLRLIGVDEYMTLENLKASRDSLSRFVQANYTVSVAVFIAIYIVWTSFALPLAAIITIGGGYLFGLVAVLYVNIGATTGATFAFFAARYLLGDWIHRKYGERLSAFNREVENNGPNYLLTLRLIPIFPFFLINVFSGLTRVRPLTYIWTTAVGIIPGTFVFAYAGKQLGAIRNVEDIISFNMLMVFILLGILAVVPVIVKKLRASA